MTEKKISTHKHGEKGFSDQMANEINKHQATKALRKMHSTKMHPSKPKQGYTPNRPSVDISTL